MLHNYRMERKLLKSHPMTGRDKEMSCTTILFPSDFYDIKKVDDSFRSEYEVVCSIPELRTAIYNHDGFIGSEPSGKALRFYPEIEPGLCIARTWMLTKQQYQILETSLGGYGVELINKVTKYETFHYFPKLYPLIKDYTPKMIHFANPEEVDAGIVSAGVSRFLIKDDVKSVKGHDFPTFFETPICQDELMQYIERFILLRDNLFSGGIVIKEFVDLKKYGNATNEYRVFYLHGEVLSVNCNSEQPESCPCIPDELVQKFRKLPSQYYTVDFGELESGAFVILEAGDGQVSGLSANQEVLKYYDDMIFILKGKGLI